MVDISLSVKQVRKLVELLKNQCTDTDLADTLYKIELALQDHDENIKRQKKRK